MSLAYDSLGKVGTPINNAVQRQLDRRQSVLSKTTGRTDDELSYLISNSSFVRIRSSVDIEEDLEFYVQSPTGGFEKVNAGVPSNIPAKNLELVTGIGNRDSRLKRGFSESSPSMMDEGYSNNSYRKNPIQGITPEGGLSEVHIATKNAYGTIREISFSFSVHSFEEFNMYEKLYLRPGFSILIEWGHTVYYDSELNLQTDPPDPFKDIFFDKMKREDILSKIFINKYTSGCNYDGVYGIIKNFSWSYNGHSYVVKVDVVTQGEILESLSTNIPPFKESLVNTVDNANNDATTYTTDIHRFLELIKSTVSRSEYKTENEIPVDQETGALEDDPILAPVKKGAPNLLSAVNQDFIDAERKISIASIDASGFSPTKVGNNIKKLVPLRLLLSLMNHVFLMHDEEDIPFVRFYTGGPTSPIAVGSDDNKSKLETANETAVKRFNQAVPTPFFTFDHHFGLNPLICTIPRGKDNTSNLTYNIAKGRLTDGMQEDNVLDLLVGVDFFLDALDKRLKEDKLANSNVLQLTKDILIEIQKNLGNINHFDLDFDEDTGLYFVIDRKLTPDSSALKDAVLPLEGLYGTQLKDVTVSSAISSNIVSQMSIAATSGTGANVRGNFDSMQKWNAGVIDRHKEYAAVGSARNSNEKTKEKLKESTSTGVDDKVKTRLVNFVKGANANQTTDKVVPSIYVDEKEFRGMGPTHQDVMESIASQRSRVAKANPQGLIPLSLSFTMKGISGVKIGEAFTIQDYFLPERYRGNIGFIITGIDHEIQNNEWTTSIKGNMFVLTKYVDPIEDIPELEES